jgi:crotonobetainyl-CoA:carnitine CoA-transferase CaiB-like acyl-CoA transferase
MLFQDIKIIELSGVLAGPLVGTFFAEMGASVLKIENKLSGGDITRSWRSPSENPDTPVSAYFAAANYHKKSAFLDLHSPKAVADILEIARQADIITVNFKSGDAKRYGLDYNTLKSVNPAIVYAEISGFGEDDERLAYDVILQAETGFMFMNGEQNGPPVKMPVALIDVLAAHQLKEGILIALMQRSKTGKGARVSVSLYDAAISSLANQASNWLMTGHSPQRMGSGHPNIAPYGDVFRTKDQAFMVFAIGSDKHFAQLCHVLDLPALAIDEKFSKNTSRVKNRTELILLLQDAVATWKLEDLLLEMQHLRIPAAEIKDLPKVFEDPAAKAMILDETLENGFKTRRAKSIAFRISE